MDDASGMTMMKMTKRSRLLSTAAMTPAERARGRFMRAPDHADAPPAADPAPVDPAPDAPSVDPAPSDDTTVLGGDAPPEKAKEDEQPPKEGEDKTGADDPAPGAPEAYDLKAPEGMDFDADALALAEPVLRDLNLTNEQAQKLTDVYGQIVPKLAERAQAAQAAEITAQRKAWADEAKADPEIGGANWDASIAASAKALDLLGAPAGSPFRDLLNASGLGNHPDMIRMFVKVGKALGEDPVFVDARTTQPKSREEKYYGNASA